MNDDGPPDREHSGVFLPPPLVYLGFFLAGMALERVLPLPRIAGAVGRPLGLVLIACALALALWSIGRFLAAGTAVIPILLSSAVVTGGPYRFTRNPMYPGLLLMYAGFALCFGLLWPLLLAPLVVWVMSVAVIRREEHYLARRFGDEYLSYRARVRRWL